MGEVARPQVLCKMGWGSPAARWARGHCRRRLALAAAKRAMEEGIAGLRGCRLWACSSLLLRRSFALSGTAVLRSVLAAAFALGCLLPCSPPAAGTRCRTEAIDRVVLHEPEVSQGAAIAVPLREEAGGGGAGASSVAKAGKAARLASGTFTVEELRAFGGLGDDDAVRDWFVEVKGVEVGVAIRVVSKLTALGKLGDREFDAELKRCRAPHGGLSIGCMAGLEGGSESGRRRSRRRA